ncbi:hypothetical protein EDC44_12838 [Cricetibacter osteomyelitidis]|uniref:Uncharacterized protein n=1 Tax=Cricetibacter osteomyelitidis TaxID=1521931 RepID=A0A4R2SSD7_9PAST|nr:hypothetical protein EDC44_12838 [Cricetibacter osteomyelitidis]
MKSYFKVISLITYSFLLLGCYPCDFLDWNCNRVAETSWYKNSEKCRREQQGIARIKIKYTEDIDMDIYHKCLDNPSYKFEFDPKYSD